jgi:hypothetical protein
MATHRPRSSSIPRDHRDAKTLARCERLGITLGVKNSAARLQDRFGSIALILPCA